jgi:glycosyltransferase involved in cell wall biosynthesis
MSRVVVYANDAVGSVMAGPGIRSYHFARELARHFDTALAVPRPIDIDVPDVEVIDRSGLDSEGETRLLERFDVVVAQFLPLPTMRRLAARRARVVYDLYVPFVERIGFLDADLGGDSADELPPRAQMAFAAMSRLVQRYALATGAAFLCASERQRDLWLGMLAAAGRVDLELYRADPTLRDVIDVVPFGLPAERPRAEEQALKKVFPAIADGDRILAWAGGIWNWLDPLTPIRAVARLSQRRDDVKLVFFGLTRPVPVGGDAMARRAVELARELGVLDRSVLFNAGWIPYEERQACLLHADLGISAHFESLETRFAFRTRLLDYFWAGLPVLTTRADVLGDLVDQRGIGRALPQEDVPAWEEAIEELLSDDGLRLRREAAFDDVRELFSWNRVVKPLLRLVEGRARPPAQSSWARRSLVAQDTSLRVQASLALGGPRAALRRKAAKLAATVRRA